MRDRANVVCVCVCVYVCLYVGLLVTTMSAAETGEPIAMRDGADVARQTDEERHSSPPRRRRA